ncbi:MAG: hypothetical protein IJ184_05950 [Alphaproteobacteria bacterium]|nr:hypothetical protein [Alphaproteobacteria bacterium]
MKNVKLTARVLNINVTDDTAALSVKVSQAQLDGAKIDYDLSFLTPKDFSLSIQEHPNAKGIFAGDVIELELEVDFKTGSYVVIKILKQCENLGEWLVKLGAKPPSCPPPPKAQPKSLSIYTRIDTEVSFQ